MTVLMFQKRFVEPIQAGTKRQTIRPMLKRRIKIGEELSLRHWEAKAYRSPQVEFGKVRCAAVVPIKISTTGISLGDDGWGTGYDAADPVELDRFAVRDGFSDWQDMLTYLSAPGGYGLPFVGKLIQWEPL